MATETRQFVIPRDFDLRGRLGPFAASLSGGDEAPQRGETTYYDSFDWRVFRRDALLTGETQGNARRLCWCARDGGEALACAAAAEKPGFAWDLPPGPLRERLAPVLEMRRLLPMMRVQSRSYAYTLTNDDGKIILRLFIEDGTAIDPASQRRKPLARRLRIQPLKGYPKAYKQVLRHLQQHAALAPLDDDPLTAALAAHGRTPCDYSSKLRLQLQADMPTDAAMRYILLELLTALERNEAGLREDLDSEFLHDFRVAGRRSRSALGQIKGVFPKRVVERFRGEFAWLSQVTGPCRDMDVYLLKFPQYQASLPAAVRANLEPLRGFLQDRQRLAHQRLTRALGTTRYRRFKQAWRSYLESPPPRRTTLANARRPVAEVAGERIWRMFRRILKEGEAITPASPPEALHELRKTGKKLRYLLEFFQSLYPSKKMAPLIKALKTLQDNLGDYQDLHIQMAALQGFSEQMLASGLANAQTLLAMGMLVENLERRQEQAREAFSGRFARFAAAGNRHRFKRLFGPHTTPAKAAR